MSNLDRLPIDFDGSHLISFRSFKTHYAQKYVCISFSFIWHDYLNFSDTFSRPDQKCLQAAVTSCVELSLLEFVIFFYDADKCLSIAMICFGVYLWIGIINLIVELASEARSHKSPEVMSEGECFAPPPSDFMKRLRVKQVKFKCFDRNESYGFKHSESYGSNHFRMVA